MAKQTLETIAKRTVTTETLPVVAQAIFQARRLLIAEECRQIQVDCDSWNDQHPDEEPLTVDMDFAKEL